MFSYSCFKKMAMRIFCVFFCVLLFSFVEDLFKLFLLQIFEVAEDKWFYFTCGKLKSKDLPRIILKWTNATIAIKYFYKIYIDGNFLSCLFVIVFTRYCLGIDELRTLKCPYIVRYNLVKPISWTAQSILYYLFFKHIITYCV